MASSASELLRSDPRFEPFLAPDFDAPAFASAALAADSATPPAAIVETLQAAAAALDVRLREEALAHQDSLLAHAARLADADAALQRLALSARSLAAAAARVLAEVAAPHAAAARRGAAAARLVATVELLRRAAHRARLVARLRAALAEAAAAAPGAGAAGLVRAARLLADIGEADAEADLSGLTAVAADAPFVRAAGGEVRRRAGDALRAGLAALSQADVGSALLALRCLGGLRAAADAAADAAAASVERAFAAALDPRRLAAAGAAGAGAAAAADPREPLWSGLAEAAEALRRAALEAWHLQRVLAKKRDPLTHELLSDGAGFGPGAPPPLERFWAAAGAGLARTFAAAHAGGRPGPVREALVVGYPRLAALLAEAAARLARDGAARDAPPALGPAAAAALAAAPAPLEAEYAARARARLTDAAAAAFPGGGRALPAAADVARFAARAHEELAAAAEGGERAAALAAGAVGAALRQAAQRAELMGAGAAELAPPPGGAAAAWAAAPPPCALRNAALSSALHELHRAAAALAPRLPPPAAAALAAPLEAVQAAALALAAPLFAALADAAAAALARLHELNLAGAGDAAVVETSAYARDLGRLLAAARGGLLARFAPPPGAAAPSVPKALAERLGARALALWARHAALARPLSAAGKLQLAKDGAEVEAAVAAHLAPPAALGTPLRAGRALRRLLFASNAELAAAAPGAGALKGVPRLEALLHLFSRAPAALEAPHARARLSPAQFSLWLDDHSEAEALRFISTALEAGAPKALKADPACGPLLALMRALAAGGGGSA
jgi:hypothetical protein